MTGRPAPDPLGYRQARGVVARPAGSPEPEEAVRAAATTARCSVEDCDEPGAWSAWFAFGNTGGAKRVGSDETPVPANTRLVLEVRICWRHYRAILAADDIEMQGSLDRETL